MYDSMRSQMKTAVSIPVDISIIIPCLNEAQTLGKVIDNALDAASLIYKKYTLTCEIIISDNGSSDGSLDIAEKKGVAIVNCPDKGYGNAHRFGVLASSGKYIVMGDSDGSHDFRESIPMLGKILEGYDLCIGSRFKGEIKKGAMPWANKYIGNPLLTKLSNLLFKTNISDSQCGLRAFTRTLYDKVDPQSSGMEYASEMLVKASLLNARITEMPITHHPDGRGRPPHLRPLRDGWRHFRYLMLLSPISLFFIPASIFLLCGATIFSLLLAKASGNAIRLNEFILLNDHWAIVASGLITIGHLLLLFGINMLLISIRDGYRAMNRFFYKLYQATKLELMIVYGLAAIISGVVISLILFKQWESQTFKALYVIRELTLTNTLFVVGAQNIFFGFLLYANIFLDNAAMQEKLGAYRAIAGKKSS